jgi:indole-3-glycerol phosphate synthase
MTDILEELTAARREDAQKAEALISYDELLERIAHLPPTRDFRGSFSTAKGTYRVMAELKKASPSEGLIREEFEPVKLAQELVGAGAAALSVLCEPHRFLGSRAYLTAVREVVDVPLLCKDFISTPYQVAAARAAGADAILLIAAVLNNATLQALNKLAHEFGMAALVETHTQEEIRRAVDLGFQMIGVNCRDLRTFHTDPSITADLLGLIPSDRTRLAESGLRTSQDLATLSAAGAHGFLIGTTLMRAPSPAQKLAELLGKDSSK